MAFNPRDSAHLRLTPNAIRRIVLEQSKRAHVGHIGSALSVADIIAVLFSGQVDTVDSSASGAPGSSGASGAPGAPGSSGASGASSSSGAPDSSGGGGPRDRFILSKGHAALAVYAALHLQGKMSEATLMTYCGNGGSLGVHPERELAGIEFSSGSLGQGLSVGCGAALAKRLKQEPGRVRVLLSDAELNEGSTWEAIMFAAHAKLDNLDVIVDVNGQQALGMTKDVLDLTPLVPRWQSFGWEVRQADGHDPEALVASLAIMAKGSGRPQVLLARTVSGKGVSFMESQVKWHYFPMSESEFLAAMAEVERAA
jgi:transketolase